ncbi:hypothetical protein H1C71_003905, partial [Ictidomys tridecemlineatus]
TSLVPERQSSERPKAHPHAKNRKWTGRSWAAGCSASIRSWRTKALPPVRSPYCKGAAKAGSAPGGLESSGPDRMPQVPPPPDGGKAESQTVRLLPGAWDRTWCTGRSTNICREGSMRLRD